VPFGNKKKIEWEVEEKAKATGLAVNHIMKYQNTGQFRALPPLYHSPNLSNLRRDAGIPVTTDVRPLGTVAAPAPTTTYACATVFDLCTFVAEPLRPPSSGIQPATTPAATTTEAGST
jgi:hypothetical protein